MLNRFTNEASIEMPGLREILSFFSAAAILAPPRKPDHLQNAAIEVRRELGNLTPKQPTRFDLAETHAAISHLLGAGQSLADLPIRHLKRAPWVMFDSLDDHHEPLAEQRDYLSVYLAELSERASNLGIMSLATVFLRYYPEGKPYFEPLRRQIIDLLPMATGPRARSLRQRSDEYGFYEEGGAAVLGAALTASDNPAQLLEDAGLTGILAERGFIESAIRKFLSNLQYDLSKDAVTSARLSTLLAFLAASGGKSHQVRYPGLRAELADALLLPFDSRAPSPEVRELIRNFVVKHYDDPRIKLALWQGVDDRSLAVVRRWLVDSTLEDFFRVVREGSQYDDDADRMWPYREAFWRAYLKKGVITEAWVVLGYVIARSARRFLEGHEGAYGKLSQGGGAKATHAVLILRIGDLVITEWSHTGKYRVWHEDNQSAPKFYKSKLPYSRNELVTNPDFDGSHHGAQNGNWQSNLATRIAEWTGVKATHKEYMPND